jgi:hypothetical protein
MPAAPPAPASITKQSKSGEPPRRFSSRLEARAWAHEHFAEWKESLSTEELAALSDYKGGAYALVNAYLRGQTEDPIDRARAEELIPHLDSALAKCRLPHAIIVHRF